MAATRRALPERRSDPAAAVPVTWVASQAMHGGAELYMAWMMTALGRDWVRGIVTLADGPFVGYLRERGYTVEVVRTGARPRSLLAAAWRLRRLLRRDRCAVVHADGVKAALVSALACIGTRVPVVWHKVDYARDGRLGNAVARRCRLIVGMTASVTESLPKSLGDRIRVVDAGIPHYEVDHTRARRELIQELGCGPDASVIAHFGRLHPRKGQLDLVAALPTVLERHPTAHLLLHPAPAEDEAEAAFEQEILASARRLGIDRALTIAPGRWRPIDAMAGSDVVVVPSKPDPVSGWREGFGIVGVEAMAAGTPVVAYAEDALAEVLGDCAELVPTGDRQGLARTLVRVVGDRSLRDRMAECGLRRAKRYTIERAAHDMARCYRDAISPSATTLRGGYRAGTEAVKP